MNHWDEEKIDISRLDIWVGIACADQKEKSSKVIITSTKHLNHREESRRLAIGHLDEEELTKWFPLNALIK